MAAFDPYHRWLGIPPEEQPPDHYRLLGLVRYEGDLDVIENAANQRMAHLRSFQTGQYAADSQRLLNEVASARICLLNPERKATYDEELRRAESASAIPVGPPPAPPTLTVPQPPPAEGLYPPRVGSEPQIRLGGVGDRARGSVRKRPYVSRGTLFALLGSVAALAGVILMALYREHPPEAMLAFDLGETDREDIQISIDGVEQLLPLSGPLEFACEPGLHKVIASRPGYLPYDAEVSVAKWKRLTIVPHWAEPAVLVVAWPKADREGSVLLVDGAAQDLASQDTAGEDSITVSVESGRRTVRIERPGYEAFERTIAVTAGEPIEIVPEFVPVADATARDGGQESVPQMSPDNMPSPPETAVAGIDTPAPDTNSPTQAPGRPSVPQAIQKALAVLERDPDDAGANALVCHWYLVDMDDPEQAFPYMAKMQHKSLSPLAMRELTPPTSAEEQASLGDGWWDHAEAASDPELEKVFRTRAIQWYTIARPDLHAGPVADRVASRLGEKVAAPSDRAEQRDGIAQLPEGPAVAKGEWIDLLSMVNLPRDVVRGAWQRQGPLVNTAGSRGALMLPVAVCGDYELEVQYSQVSGPPQGLNVVLPVGSRACSVFLPHNMRTDVLWNVNGQPYTTSVPQLEPKMLVRATFRVTGRAPQKQIDVAVNGKPYFVWQGSESSLSCFYLSKMPRRNQPGLTNDRDQYTVRAIRFRLLDGEARLISGSTLPPLPYLMTGDVGGFQGTVFEEHAPEGAALVGLRCETGGLGLMGLAPVYRTQEGQVSEGPWVGSAVPSSNLAVAKEGYAVGALLFETQNQWMSGVTLRFYRRKGDVLDLDDSVDSPLLGQAGTREVCIVETRGRPATGLHGLWNPGQIVSLGLVSPRPAETELWSQDEEDSRREYVSLLDLQPVQCTVAEMRYSYELGVGTCDPEYWPIIDRDSQFCSEFLYAPAPSRFSWNLTPNVRSFTAMGYCIESRTVQFRVLVDGQMVYSGQQAGVEEIRVDLPRGEQLELQVDDMGSSTGDESFWLYPRVHSRPAANVNGLDDKESRSNMLAARPPLSQEVASRTNTHQPLRPLYPVGGSCREFLYAHPPSRVVYEVPPGSKRFSAIGYCIASKGVRFRVSVNGNEAYSSQPAGIEAIQIQLPRQAKSLELWVDPSQGRSVQDQAFWCFPRFYR